MKAYDKYILNWMLTHNHSLEELIAKLDERLEENIENEIDCNSVRELFSQWEFDEGFDGELWATYGEWIDCEEG